MSLHNLSQSFLWTAVTVVCYLIGLGLRKGFCHHPLLNPVLIAIILLTILLRATHLPYAVYFRATSGLTVLLGPATIALGVPLAKQFARVRQSLRGIGVGLAIGSITSALSGIMLVRLLGGSNELAMSMLPKAATTPIAMAVAGQLGGRPTLAAILAILGGIVTAISLRTVLRFLRITDEQAIGLAAGTAGSGIAAAEVATLGDDAAAFAAIGIGLNGLFTALVAPTLATLLK